MLEFLLGRELFAKAVFRALHPLRRASHLAPQRFLVHQFLEDDHLQRTLAQLRFHAFWYSVVRLRVREDSLNFAVQIAVGQNRAVDSCYGLSGSNGRSYRRICRLTGIAIWSVG